MIAKLIVGGSNQQRLERLNQLLDESKLKLNHPDLLYFVSDEKLGIEQARKIKEHFSLKPYQAKGRAVVIEEGSNLTPDAQNSLLKTLEELPTEALFIIAAVTDVTFLPTVLSRVQVTHLNTSADQKNSDHPDISKLQSATISERFEFIEKLKDRDSFLPALVSYFRQQVLKNQGQNPTLNSYLAQLLQAEVWAKQNVNIRAILEYLMLQMPDRGK